jgi:hypothetical protein
VSPSFAGSSGKGKAVTEYDMIVKVELFFFWVEGTTGGGKKRGRQSVSIIIVHYFYICMKIAQ